MVKQRTETRAKTAESDKTRLKRRTFAGRILRTIIIIFVLCVGLAVAAGMVLINRPEMLGLGETLTERVSELTGFDCRAVGPVEVGIFPTPYIQIYRVSLFDPAAPGEAPAPEAAEPGGGGEAPAAQNATLSQNSPAVDAAIPNAPLLPGFSVNGTGGAAVYQAAAHPSMAAANGPRPFLSVAAVRLELRILPLFSGEISLQRVKFLDPRLELDVLEAALGKQAAGSEDASALEVAASAPQKDSAANHVANATAPAANATGAVALAESMGDDVLAAEGIGKDRPMADASLDLPLLLDMLPDIEISGGAVFGGGESSSRTMLAGNISFLFAEDNLALSLRSHALGDAHGRPSTLDLTLKNLSASGGEIKGTARLLAELNVLGQTLRPEITAELAYAPESQRLAFANFALSLEKLRIKGNFAARFPAGGFRVAGHLEHEGLSLPRWFQFGRNLPGSLQYALDDLSGYMDFDLNQDRLIVSRMSTRVLGMTLEGDGGTPDFAAPVVVINATGSFLDVNTIFPEVVDPPPDTLPRVHYAEPPLVGGGNVDESDLPDVGHDIKISGAKALVRKLKVDDLAVRIVPSERGTQCLFAMGGVAGGKMDADLTVLSDSDKIEIDARPVNLSVQVLGEDLFGRAPLTTQVSGAAKVAALPDTLSTFFRSMDAEFALKFSAGSLYLRESKRTLKFDSVVASGRGSSVAGQDGSDSMLLFAGDWNFQAVSGKEKINAALKGPLGVDEKSLDLFTPGGNLSAEASADMPFLGVNSGHTVKFAGNFAYDDRTRALKLNKATATLPYGTAAGDVACREFGASGETWTGNAKMKVASTRDWLGYMGFDRESLPMQGLGKGDFAFNFEQSGAKWAVQNVAFLLDENVRGKLNLSQAADNSYVFALNIESINIDNYYPPRKTSSALPSPRPWDLSSLLKTKVKGAITIKDLGWRKLHYSNVATSLTLENGKFNIPTTAAFYGGQNKADLSGTLEPNRVNAKFSLDFKGAQLGAITKDLYSDERAAGRINISLAANGSPARASEILTAFSGNWSFDVGAGHFRGKRDEGTGKEPSKTEFSAIKASGRMHGGRLETDNFTLSAPGSTDTLGRGYVDIARDTIDMDFEVRMLGIDVPVKLSGALDDPKTTVKSGKLIGNAVGGIGSGLFGLVVDVITLPGKVIMLPFGKDSGQSGGGGSGQ